jgi:fluoride ion exporter CrcB/FEX
MLPGTEDKPTFPLNLMADFAGGGVMCAVGILLALIERGRSGRGQVVNADMVKSFPYGFSLVNVASRFLVHVMCPRFLLYRTTYLHHYLVV